jgi:FAD/FMN-containing dehydrogenase
MEGRPLRQRLSGWGNFPAATTDVRRPEQLRTLPELLAGSDHLIARGLGRSYGDEAVCSQGSTVLMTRLNRFLALEEPQQADRDAILRCEAGVSFAEIIAHLLPRGYFPPVTPGTKFVTVGGAIANDVHGKNHHVDGSFASCLLDFELLLPSGDQIHCSRTEHADVFWATIGGIGLTGVIVEARLRLRRVPSAYLTVRYLRARNLAETIDGFRSTDASERYSVAWVDCLARGAAAGRAVLMNGDHTPVPELPPALRATPYAVRPSKARTVPVVPPRSLIDRRTTAAFNALYYARHRSRKAVVDYERFFYPLDGVQHWNRIYGPAGFVQCQAVFPEEEGPRALGDVLATLGEARKPCFLAVLKRTGEASGGLLSFPRRGWTLAVDIPVTPDLPPFMEGLHARIVGHGGRVYLAKDSTLSAGVFERMYPEVGAFAEVRDRCDPGHRLSSAMSMRLGIGGGGQ